MASWSLQFCLTGSSSSAFVSFRRHSAQQTRFRFMVCFVRLSSLPFTMARVASSGQPRLYRSTTQNRLGVGRLLVNTRVSDFVNCVGSES